MEKRAKMFEEREAFIVTLVRACLKLTYWQYSTNLSRGETHDPVHGSLINLMKLPNEGTLIFLVPASNHFMF